MRSRLEQTLRAIVIVALAVMLLQSLRPSTDSFRGEVHARGSARSTLARWSALSSPPARIHIQLDSVPAPYERAWLGALAGAGSSVTWSGDLSALMVDAQPVAAPTGGTRVLVAALRGSTVVLGDEVGAIDTLRTQNAGASITLGAISDRVTARAKGTFASSAQTDSVVLGRLLVIGAAGWESKFVLAALEEKGWKVDALIRLAPGVDVTQGSASAIDTARYSAVIALDSTASPYAGRIVRFVRNGGGAILAPSAAQLDGFSGLRAGNTTSRVSETSSAQSSGSVSLATLPLAPITVLREDAIPIERRGAAITIAVKRVAAGRALQLGYEDTWLWRMSGGANGVEDHRRWWTGLVSSVAYAPRIPRATSVAKDPASVRNATDPAPLSELVATIGPSMSTGLMSNTGGTSNAMAWLFALFAAALVVEVASRRLRGAS